MGCRTAGIRFISLTDNLLGAGVVHGELLRCTNTGTYTLAMLTATIGLMIQWFWWFCQHTPAPAVGCLESDVGQHGDRIRLCD